MTHLLRSLARRAEARVFCVTGSRFAHDARLLRSSQGIRLAASPHGANLLLIVGELDPGFVAPALVAHDALSPPRATLWWRLESQAPLVSTSFPDAIVVEDTDPVPALKRTHEELLRGDREGEEPLLPDVEPAPWRGIGPYGQGGKAMTAGVPYGRPMPERADDRDGLKLDFLPVRVGPLFAPFPVGLALDLKLHGDVIQEATVENFADASALTGSIFNRALRSPIPIRELEVARAQSHLEWLSDAVAVAGAASLSERILRFARRIAPGDGDDVRSLERSLRRRGFLGWNTRAVGIIEGDLLHEITGPVARASGLTVDLRADEDVYRRLGFEPVMQADGDAAARWIQRLLEAAQALELAARAGDENVGGEGAIESPRGALTDQDRPSRATARLVASLIAGMEWGDAVTTIVSLDLDMAEANTLSLRSAAS
ncbi:MAG: hypothetical protein M3277_10630 [Actinomycetota bacterium]|nr:hypothetical protein [Actinomycetota bacterium]